MSPAIVTRKWHVQTKASNLQGMTLDPIHKAKPPNKLESSLQHTCQCTQTNSTWPCTSKGLLPKDKCIQPDRQKPIGLMAKAFNLQVMVVATYWLGYAIHTSMSCVQSHKLIVTGIQPASSALETYKQIFSLLDRLALLVLATITIFCILFLYCGSGSKHVAALVEFP